MNKQPTIEERIKEAENILLKRKAGLRIGSYKILNLNEEELVKAVELAIPNPSFSIDVEAYNDEHNIGTKYVLSISRKEYL